jgi:subtilisin family serine protease
MSVDFAENATSADIQNVADLLGGEFTCGDLGFCGISLPSKEYEEKLSIMRNSTNPLVLGVMGDSARIELLALDTRSKAERIMENLKETIMSWYSHIFCVEAQVAQSEPTTDLKNLQTASSSLVLSYDKIKIFDAWNAIMSSSTLLFQSTTTIGIIDTGVDVANEEFLNINFGNSSPFARTDKQPDAFPEKGDSGHGTAIAGIIGANNISAHQSYFFPQMNGILSGVTEKYVLESRSMALFNSLAGSMINGISGDIAGYESYIRNLPPQSIINMSIGISAKDEDKNQTTQYFSRLFRKNNDKLFLISAGNGGKNASLKIPENITGDNIIVVSATDLSDDRAIFPNGSSNFGPTVIISAPGSLEIYAPSIRGKGSFPNEGSNAFNYTTQFGGTSGATPLVTGVAGLLKAIKPSLTPAEIKQILIRTADPIFAETGSDEAEMPLGSGCTATSAPQGMTKRGCRLNAYKAVCDSQVGLNCAQETGTVQGYTRKGMDCESSEPPH